MLVLVLVWVCLLTVVVAARIRCTKLLAQVQVMVCAPAQIPWQEVAPYPSSQ